MGSFQIYRHFITACIISLLIFGCSNTSETTDGSGENAHHNTDASVTDKPQKPGTIPEQQKPHEQPLAPVVPDANISINEVLITNNRLTASVQVTTDNRRLPWIELYNRGSKAVDLSPYLLRRDGNLQQTWHIPQVTLGARQFLRIWGSGLDQTAVTGELHTGFSIMGSSRLELIDTRSGNVVDRFDHINIPDDHSFGRYPDGADKKLFFLQPTPGSANSSVQQKPFVIDHHHLSLTAGKSFQLTVTSDYPVNWKSNSPAVTVDSQGNVFAKDDKLGGEAHATITATATDGSGQDSCEITIVGWTANRSTLTIENFPSTGFLLGRETNRIYHTRGPEAYSSTDGLKTSTLLGAFPDQPNPPVWLKTPLGYFVRTGNKIFQSSDMVVWNEIETTHLGGLIHMFDYQYDAASQTVYLYTGEYSTASNDQHKVIRGRISPGQAAQWEDVETFDSLDNESRNQKSTASVRHIHVVTVDPYTGHIWVGTGDANQHARLYYSRDRGKTFHLVAMGAQKYRTLSIWFTKGYVYWNTDSEMVTQVISRISRQHYSEANGWPAITPTLNSGYTKQGVRYFVFKDTSSYFPAARGQFFTETKPRKLDSDHAVIAITDPAYTYDKVVARLSNGSQWYHCWVKDNKGEDIVLMGASAEGNENVRRDNRGRLFGIKEKADGSVDVQELMSVSPNSSGPLAQYVQIIPALQDDDGYIYLRGRETWHRIYKARLHWVDQ